MEIIIALNECAQKDKLISFLQKVINNILYQKIIKLNSFLNN